MPVQLRSMPILLAPLLLAYATSLAASEIPLENGDFEDPARGACAPGWQWCVIGPQPEGMPDTTVLHAGKASFRLASSAPTDAAIQQHVQLEPSAYYILRGWVRTEALKPDPGTEVYGTLAVMSPGGPGEGHRLASGTPHDGDADWVQVSVPFETPADGRVRVMCFLAGWGRGTGTVWFDSLEITKASEEPVKISVSREEIVPEPVNPMLYGNFIESGFGRQLDGMWSQMLFNRSFEEITPYKESVWGWLSRKPEDDLSKEDWWHSGYEKCPWYVAPGNPEVHLGYSEYWDFHHGVRAAHFTNRNNTSKATLAQDGLFLRKGTACRFSGYLRHGELSDANVPPMTITVGLYKEGRTTEPVVTETLRGIGSPWRHFECDLNNTDYEGRATLAITVPPGANLALDGLSLMPLGNVNGWRPDVVEALKRVQPPILRWPGGCFASFYNWRDGIGPSHERRPRESTYWGGLENNDVGTAEFVTLCREIGAEPFICANVMTGSPEEAAEWVAYCNASADHPMGALRTQHGYPEPFDVTYWELDNETYRKYGALEYAERCVEFSKAMKAVAPNIKLVMVGYWRFNAFLPEMLEIAGPHIDLVTDRGLDEGYLRGVLKTLQEYNEKSGRDIRLCNTEWLAPSGDVPVVPDALNRHPDNSELTLQNRQIRWRYAMNAAKQLLVFQRLGGEFAFANFNNLANTWGQNVIECPKEGCYLSAAGKVFELFSACPAAWPLRLKSNGTDFGVVTQAAWDLPRERLVLIALNYRREKAQVTWDLSELGLQGKPATLTVLSAPSGAAFNSLQDPGAVRVQTEERGKAAADAMSYALPPNSILMAVIG